MMWCQWQLVRTRMMVSKWLKGGAEGLKIQNIWQYGVDGADEYLERLEGKIRKCLFFYVKI